MLSKSHLCVSALALIAALPETAAAQVSSYPNRLIIIVVPFAAGGPTDVVARLLGERMGQRLGQQMLIENVMGSGGTVGMARVANAPPDGYTLGVGNTGTQSAAPALYPGLKYDPAKSFTQIGITNFTPQVIVSRTGIPAATLGELIAYVKANSDKATYGHSGIGAISHVAGTIFNAEYGLKPAMVPYRGVAPALTDLVSGQIDYMVDQAMNVIPQIQASSIKVYAIAASERLASLPDVPTTAEAGSDFVFRAWNGLVAPAGLPKDVADKLVAALAGSLEDPLVLERFANLGSTAPQGQERGQDGLQSLVEREVASIGPALTANVAAEK